MKTDTDYIRRGVELADGYQISELTNDGVYFSLPHGSYLPPIINCPQQYIDAIVCQLVRQVDALCVTDLEIYSNTTYIGTDHYDNFSSEGPDRAMNTLKAIVDSKVLEK